MVSNRRPQFTAELTKKLNRMLGIETKLSTLFHSQTDSQIRENELRIRIIFKILCQL